MCYILAKRRGEEERGERERERERERDSSLLATSFPLSHRRERQGLALSMAIFSFVRRSINDSCSTKHYLASENGGCLEGSADSSFNIQLSLSLSLSPGASRSFSSSF